MSWRVTGRPPALAVMAFFAASCSLMLARAADAQSIMRSPTINLPSRTPTINANVAARIAPNLAPRTPGISTGAGVGSVVRVPRIDIPRLSPGTAIRPATPYVHYSPNLYPPCARDSDDECLDQPLAPGGGRRAVTGRTRSGNARRDTVVATPSPRSPAGELVAEIDPALSETQTDELARRHGLRRITSQNFRLVDATIALFRISNGRSLDTARRELLADGAIRAVQPNYRYLLQDDRTEPREGDPAQYALAKVRLPAAHRLARGADVTIAVIDSGIDAAHPELLNSIADTFDALGSKEGPHAHGTGIAGVIAAHARLMGSAPEARILAIRAFGAVSGTVQSNSYVILRALDYAVEHRAQIVNMSFAGPKDPLIERAITAAAARGLVLVAAAGNAGPKSPPLYPAANPDVIAVSATDSHDRLFAASNRGNYIALAAPGVDIFVPAPGGKYQISSGTSFSAALVSGVAALVLGRGAGIKPETVRAILTRTARDLGAPGRDDEFGAGEADAYAALLSLRDGAAGPVAAASDAPSATTKREAANSAPDDVRARIVGAPAPGADEKPAISEVDSEIPR